MEQATSTIRKSPLKNPRNSRLRRGRMPRVETISGIKEMISERRAEIRKLKSEKAKLEKKLAGIEKKIQETEVGGT